MKKIYNALFFYFIHLIVLSHCLVNGGDVIAIGSGILNHASRFEKWDFPRVGASSSTIFVSLYWKDAIKSSITDPSKLLAAHWISDLNLWKDKQAETYQNGGDFIKSGIACDNFSKYTIETSEFSYNPPPLSLLSFDAKCEDTLVEINWATITETNNNYFTIERSCDAANWHYISKVNGAGNSNMIQNYFFEDKNPPKGVSYYRLKQTDFDGFHFNSNSVSVGCEQSEDTPIIEYYPNPFSSIVFVDFNNINVENSSIMIYDILGKIVFKTVMSSSDIKDQKYLLNLEYLPSGLYTAEFISDNYKNTSKLLK